MREKLYMFFVIIVFKTNQTAYIINVNLQNKINYLI